MKISDTAKSVLSQLATMINQLKPEDYCLPIGRLGNSTLGQHVRHTLEFFICLKEGTNIGSINYDQRRRDQNLETNPQNALSTIKDIKNYIDSTTAEESLTLEVDYGMKEGMIEQIITNFNRELAYNIEHAIHHMAILKIGVHEIAPYVSLPEEFGIAVSTLRYRKEYARQT